MSIQSKDTKESGLEERTTLAIYSEICKSYHAIDAFRMKLLGLLPLASLVGVLFVDRERLAIGPQLGGAPASELIEFASVFAALLTMALFLYELRGIQRTHSLISAGERLEQSLGVVHGQFSVCTKEHKNAPIRGLNAKLIACVIYSLVFSEWFFVALRFGFEIETRTCVLWASGTGIAIAFMTYLLVKKLTPS